MKQIMPFLAVFGVGIIIGACSCALVKPRHECPNLETSLKVNDPGTARFLTNRIKTLEWPNADGTVSRYSVGDESAPNRNLTMSGREPLSLPDDHGHMTLTLVEIRDNKAKIAYVNEFYHMSFGKNLITVDCGIVEIDVPKKEPQQSSGGYSSQARRSSELTFGNSICHEGGPPKDHCPFWKEGKAG